MTPTDPPASPNPADAAAYIASMAADLMDQARRAGHMDLAHVLAQVVHQARSTAKGARQADERV